MILCFFLFHPRDYYKLCVTLRNSVIRLTIYESLDAQWRMVYKLRYDRVNKSRDSFLFNRRVLISFMRLVARWDIPPF